MDDCMRRVAAATASALFIGCITLFRLCSSMERVLVLCVCSTMNRIDQYSLALHCIRYSSHQDTFRLPIILLLPFRLSSHEAAITSRRLRCPTAILTCEISIADATIALFVQHFRCQTIASTLSLA